MPKLNDISLGAFADGDNAMGFFKRLAELPPVNQRVPPVVELGMTHKDEVVNGDNGVDTSGFYALWQFSRQPMEHVYAVA